MNAQIAKNIRRYVRIRIEDEKPGALKSPGGKFYFEEIYKRMKRTYETATPEVQKAYREDMQNRFNDSQA